MFKMTIDQAYYDLQDVKDSNLETYERIEIYEKAIKSTLELLTSIKNALSDAHDERLGIDELF